VRNWPVSGHAIFSSPSESFPVHTPRLLIRSPPFRTAPRPINIAKPSTILENPKKNAARRRPSSRCQRSAAAAAKLARQQRVSAGRKPVQPPAIRGGWTALGQVRPAARHGYIVAPMEGGDITCLPSDRTTPLDERWPATATSRGDLVAGGFVSRHRYGRCNPDRSAGPTFKTVRRWK